jgi:hypothetical protein
VVGRGSGGIKLVFPFQAGFFHQVSEQVFSQGAADDIAQANKANPGGLDHQYLHAILDSRRALSYHKPKRFRMTAFRLRNFKLEGCCQLIEVLRKLPGMKTWLTVLMGRSIYARFSQNPV